MDILGHLVLLFTKVLEKFLENFRKIFRRFFVIFLFFSTYIIPYLYSFYKFSSSFISKLIKIWLCVKMCQRPISILEDHFLPFETILYPLRPLSNSYDWSLSFSPFVHPNVLNLDLKGRWCSGRGVPPKFSKTKFLRGLSTHGYNAHSGRPFTLNSSRLNPSIYKPSFDAQFRYSASIYTHTPFTRLPSLQLFYRLPYSHYI